MTQERKNAIVDDIMALLIQLTDEETIQETSRKKPVEMLTINSSGKGTKRTHCSSTGGTEQGQIHSYRSGQTWQNPH